MRSIKQALTVIVKNRLHTEKSLCTLLCEVESFMDSWSLTDVSDDINVFNALALTHILLSEETLIYSPANITDDEIDLRDRELHKQRLTYSGQGGWRNTCLEFIKNGPKNEKIYKKETMPLTLIPNNQNVSWKGWRH